jgi:hypothetical protein
MLSPSLGHDTLERGNWDFASSSRDEHVSPATVRVLAVPCSGDCALLGSAPYFFHIIDYRHNAQHAEAQQLWWIKTSDNTAILPS